jgi:hypothetical protein
MNKNMTNKKGRNPLPPDQRRKATSISLSPELLKLYREIGGNQWLKGELERIKWGRIYNATADTIPGDNK